MDEFNPLSKKLTSSLSKAVKKSGGIYFTPQSIISKIFERLSFEGITSILEPSCGSLEFIKRLDEKTSGKQITAIEKNAEIYDAIKNEELKNNSLKIIRNDFLTADFQADQFDLIIGNPPFYVMKKGEISKEYLPFVTGRPNIFALFVMRAMKLLKKNGVLAFVLPTSFLNSQYYNLVRKEIFEKMKIIDIIPNGESDFMGTAQETCSIILRNCGGKNDKFAMEFGDGIVFSAQTNAIKDLLKGSTTLSKLGCQVFIGKVVWNSVKNLLTDDQKQTLLIYSGDISSSKNLLDIKEYTNPEKRNYIQKQGSTEPIIVVNRGYGTGSYHFNYALIDLKRPFLVENHLICIKHPDKNVYEKILKSFEDPRTDKFIEMYFGNNAVSSTELWEILPIY